MLNELFALSQILNNSGIEQKEWHKELKELKKITKDNPCFRIWVSKDCSIKGIEKLGIEQVSGLRKYEVSYGHSMPVFNCPKLWLLNEEYNNDFCVDYFKELVTEDTQKRFFEQNKKLKKENKGSFDVYFNKIDKKLKACTKDIPKQLKGLISENIKNSLTELIEILLKDSFNFQERLKLFIIEQLDKRDNYEIISEFLSKDNISVVLDFKEWQELDNDFKYPIVNEKTSNFINEVLFKSDQKTNLLQDKKYGTKDAFGAESELEMEKFGGLKLPNLGNIIFRSMTKESPCNVRYGRIESESYPISKDNIANIKKAIEWLSSKDRKGKNWVVADSKELLFVYPSKLSDIKIADIFGGSDDEDSNNDSETVADFEKRAEEVVKALTKLSTDGETINIELFTLKSIDDGHKNISYYRNYNAEKLIEAANDWNIGCKNIPNIPFEIKIPFPLDIAKITNKLYKMDGSENNGGKKLKPVSSYQGLNIMLEENNAELIHYILGNLLINHYGLIKYLGGQINNRRKSNLKDKKNYIFTVIGLLLHKLKVKKEHYMDDFPFLLGQMLKISDELHALWCEVVRKGNLPPQLAGNSLFTSATETPLSALSQLGSRVNPYHTWAKQYRTKKEEKSGLAAWYIKLYEQNANRLKNILPNSNIMFNDAEKAQLFIGYLASFSKQGEHNEQ